MKTLEVTLGECVAIVGAARTIIDRLPLEQRTLQSVRELQSVHDKAIVLIHNANPGDLFEILKQDIAELMED